MPGCWRCLRGSLFSLASAPRPVRALSSLAATPAMTRPWPAHALRLSHPRPSLAVSGARSRRSLSSFRPPSSNLPAVPPPRPPPPKKPSLYDQTIPPAYDFNEKLSPGNIRRAVSGFLASGVFLAFLIALGFGTYHGLHALARYRRAARADRMLAQGEDPDKVFALDSVYYAEAWTRYVRTQYENRFRYAEAQKFSDAERRARLKECIARAVRNAMESGDDRFDGEEAAWNHYRDWIIRVSNDYGFELP